MFFFLIPLAESSWQTLKTIGTVLFLLISLPSPETLSGGTGRFFFLFSVVGGERSSFFTESSTVPSFFAVNRRISPSFLVNVVSLFLPTRVDPFVARGERRAPRNKFPLFFDFLFTEETNPAISSLARGGGTRVFSDSLFSPPPPLSSI